MTVLVVASNTTQFFRYLNSIYSEKDINTGAGEQGPNRLSCIIKNTLYLYIIPSISPCYLRGYVINQLVILSPLPIKTYEQIFPNIMEYRQPEDKKQSLLNKIKELEEQVRKL